MNTLRFVAAQAWQEFRAGCRGPLLAIVFPGLIGYALIVILNADYMREMGATEVPRNSPHVIYLMMAGQAVWIFFVWAWLFGLNVVRDRNASLHEVVLSTPVSLPALLFGRYLGALALSTLLPVATAIGFWLVPALGALGIIPPDAVGPHPWFAMAHSLLLFTLPTAAGVGALFLCAAIWTRSIAGPFAVAAMLMLVWMVAMVVVRGGDASPAVATLLDASGFAEIEEQTNLMTPREKAVAVIELTPPLLVNRLIWTLPPLLLLAVVLRRVNRERLALEKAPATRRRRSQASGARAKAPPESTLPPGPAATPSWLRATWTEAAWHLKLSFRGWGTPLALAMMVATGVGGAFVHVVLHADGPLQPRSGLVERMTIEYFYLVVVFMVAAFVGVMARRDDRTGWNEISDATPAPVGTRVVGRALASLCLTVAFALTPLVAVWIVTGLALPGAFSLANPAPFFALLLAPALLEVAAVVLLAHALIRHPGAAHAVSVICAFIIVVNHELAVTTYPPAEFGVPAHATVSEFAGWGPWINHLLTADLFKLAIVAVLVAVAWLAWPRGTALTVPMRWRTALGRVPGGAGVLAAAGVVLAFGTHVVLYEQFVTLGGYQSEASEVAEDAAWEKRWWASATPFSTAGGEAVIDVDPAGRTATARWHLDGVRSASGLLHGALPDGAEIQYASVGGEQAAVTVALDQFALELGDCGRTGEEGCTVKLDLTVRDEGWADHGESRWLHESGVWLRAADVLPALGHDPDRLVRAPHDRELHGLPDDPAAVDAHALSPAMGVAPAGEWSWTVRFASTDDADPSRQARTATAGQVSGPLDFAAAWWPRKPMEANVKGVTVYHGSMRSNDVEVVLNDVTGMRSCVAGLLGRAPAVGAVLQAPRELGATALHGDLLWLPEHEGWDVAADGFGHRRRRATLAAALAARQLADDAGLRREPGEDWLRVGVSGWIGMECVRRADGRDAWLALHARVSGQVIEAFGALDAPAISVEAAGDVPWIRHYTPLATAAWVESIGPAEAVAAIDEVIAAVRAGGALPEALAAAIGEDDARALLGPPASSDVLVAESGRTVEIAGQRWLWRDGGWEPLTVPIHVTQRYEDGSDERHRIGPVPATTEPDAPFTIIDAWPSFERSPSDNVWRGEGGGE
ncbi:MAG: ABC transporter permease [Acidobacteria bacterium]|nr:ABC transporter permease [Acidobacteriota bacterium]